MQAAIRNTIETVIARGGLAGAATLVWRRSRVLQTAAYGFGDLAAWLPLARDDLFRIASMTKPMTSALSARFMRSAARVG